MSFVTSSAIGMVMLLMLASAGGVERRRPLYRRASTTTSIPLVDDSEGSESKYKPNEKDLYTVKDSYPAAPAFFKPDCDKLTSFSETRTSSTKHSCGVDGAGSDEDSSAGTFKNHKQASPLLPTTNANNKERRQGSFTGGSSSFINGDYTKSKLPSPSGSHTYNEARIGGISGPSKSKLPSTISSKFSIAHPTPSAGSKATGKLSHLDDSTEFDVYSSLGQSSIKTRLDVSNKHRSPLTSSYSQSSVLEGKDKKVSFKYEEGGLGALVDKAKSKTKLTLADDTPLGSSHGTLGTSSSSYTGHGSYETNSYDGSRQQQSNALGIGTASLKAGKFNFAEPPALVKSTLNTLKYFGEGLIGNANGAGRTPYEFAGGLESEETYQGTGVQSQGIKFGSYFGKGHFGSAANNPAVEESYDSSGAPLSKGKFPKPVHGTGAFNGIGGKFATDFDVKNIVLTDSGTYGAAAGNKLLKPNNSQPHYGKHGSTPNNAGPSTHGHTIHYSQQGQQQLHNLHPQQQQHVHHTAHGTTGTIDNPNPLDFRPNFKLQDVPNLYPAAHLGAGIAAKGQIESFLNSDQTLKDESLVAQLLGDSNPASRPHYHQFLKSQEDEKLEKEALRQQIEYLKAHAAKRPVDINGPHRPAIVSNVQKFRPVRRIPSHVRLGVKTPYPLPRIPNYNDRPYSISFKI